MSKSASETLLTVENLCIGKKNPGSHILVKNINFTLQKSEILGIAGESGSGKTLTACAIAGLLPSSLKILSGKVLFHGHKTDPVNHEKPGFHRGRDLLLLFQSPLSALSPASCIGIQVAETLRAANKSPMKEVCSQAQNLMEMVGLSSALFDSYPFQLSGGQRQRVLLAMAFGLKPRLLIADEPTAAQDDQNRDNIIQLLVKLKQEAGSAIIIISHDMRILKRISEKLLLIYQGKQVEAGNTSEIISRPMHPHTRELVEAMHFLENKS